MRNVRRAGGFTLIELLMVVLIIGILASIAIPTYGGQRTKVKNAAAQTTVRSAVSAASQWYFSAGQSYQGLTPKVLSSLEASLTADPSGRGSGTGVLLGTTPGAAADPAAVYVGNGAAQSVTDPTTTATLVVICAVSKGTGTYCAKGESGKWTYAKSETSQGLAAVIAGGFTENAW